jgi:hypothetical protein
MEEETQERYFITGLPRSRTAWLANFFTYGLSWCWHEGIKFKENHMEIDGYQYIGDSDSSHVMQHELQWKYPKAKVVIVKRNEDDVRASLREMFKHMAKETVDKSLDANIGALEVFRQRCLEISQPLYEIPFEDLDSEKEMERMWNFLLPTIKFPLDRYKALNILTIEPHFDKYMAVVEGWMKGE